MSKECGIYLITSPTGKRYIGQAVDIVALKRIYKGLFCESQRYLYHSLRKHGYGNHAWQILCLCEPEELNYYEIACISVYQTLTPNGMNLTTGGNGNGHLSEETKNKIRQSNMGKPSIYKGMTGRYTEETLEKMRNAKRGKIVTQSTRDKISQTRKGRESNRKGVTLSEETKHRMSVARKLYFQRLKGEL